MKPTTINIKGEGINLYWNMLKDLSSDMKLELIAKLSSSLIATEKSKVKKNWIDDFCGKWEDDRNSEDIINDIRSARTSNRDIDLLKNTF
jgi:hypothetical protein